MVEILTDIQIMESAINYKKNTNQATYDLKDKGYDTIFLTMASPTRYSLKTSVSITQTQK